MTGMQTPAAREPRRVSSSLVLFHYSWSVLGKSVIHVEMWSVIFIGNLLLFIKQSIEHETDAKGPSEYIYLYVWVYTVYICGSVLK